MNQLINRVLDIIFIVIGAMAYILFAGLLLSLPVMLLWNGCLVGAVAGVAPITWLQGWGIMILCGFLFKTGK
jgi:hypothetical protein